MSGAVPEVEFWFEFASPYTYPAAMRALAEERVRFALHPFLLGPVFSANGLDRSPNLAVPDKERYMWRDVARTCARLKLPFRKPTAFPARTVYAARVAMLGAEADWGRAFIALTFRAIFDEDLDVSAPEVLARLVSEAGAPPDTLEAIRTPEIKARLVAQAEAARGRGVFGSPSFVAGGELFWGNDRYEDAVAWALNPESLRISENSPDT